MWVIYTDYTDTEFCTDWEFGYLRFYYSSTNKYVVALWGCALVQAFYLNMWVNLTQIASKSKDYFPQYVMNEKTKRPKEKRQNNNKKSFSLSVMGMYYDHIIVLPILYLYLRSGWSDSNHFDVAVQIRCFSWGTVHWAVHLWL